LSTSTPTPDTVTPDGSAASPRPVSVRYLGFRSADDGREYTLRVDGAGEPRVFVLVIPHAAFVSRQTRFQDAPDLCYTKLQRELAKDPNLLPGRLLVTAADLADYRELQTRRSPDRKRRRQPKPPE
jgi:hypothetical protein